MPAALSLLIPQADLPAQGTRNIQRIRPLDRHGLIVFEDPKTDTVTDIRNGGSFRV